jgi:hypothetical protein
MLSKLRGRLTTATIRDQRDAYCTTYLLNNSASRPLVQWLLALDPAKIVEAITESSLAQNYAPTDLHCSEKSSEGELTGACIL